MRRSYNVFSIRRMVHPSGLFLRRLFLTTLISFSTATSFSAYAQESTADVCRETKKLYEQDQREESDLQRKIVIKNAEQGWQQSLLELRRAVAGNYVVSGLNDLASQLSFPSPTVSTKERMALQRTVLDLLERLIPEVKNIGLRDLELQIDRNAQRLSTRRKRMKDLNCNEVLAREKSSSSSSFNLAGRWTAHWGNGSEIGKAFIKQEGDKLTFYDLCCGKTSTEDPHNQSTGYFEKGNKVIAKDWGAIFGEITDNGNRINWSNGTYWTR